jgi:hypothetical protein
LIPFVLASSCGQIQTQGNRLPILIRNDTTATPMPDPVTPFPESSRVVTLDTALSDDGAVLPLAGTTGLFTAAVTVAGGIRYFAGQTNALGQTLPVNPLRFLALERLRLVMDFSQDPVRIEIRLLDRLWIINGVSGKTRYETYLFLPELPETLSWSGQRLAPPMSLLVTATARADPNVTASASVDGLELTGDVREIVRVQPFRS